MTKKKRHESAVQERIEVPQLFNTCAKDPDAEAHETFPTSSEDSDIVDSD